MRKNIVAGNWKMNKNLQEGIALAKELNEALTADKPNCDAANKLLLARRYYYVTLRFAEKGMWVN